MSNVINTSSEEYFFILDALRESGQMNMFGAPKWLREEYGLSKQESMSIFLDWTKHCEDQANVQNSKQES